MYEDEDEGLVRLRAEVRRLKLGGAELRRLNGELAGLLASGEALRDRMHLAAILGTATVKARVKETKPMQINQPAESPPVWDIMIGHMRARCAWDAEEKQFVVQVRTVVAWDPVAKGKSPSALLQSFIGTDACQRVLVELSKVPQETAGHG